jgi:sugar O-acyltransferase (sialic acid O-acetyltransferase NeuD family)
VVQRLIILGRTGNAADILDIVEAINRVGERWRVEGILDDAAAGGSQYFGFNVLGPLRSAVEFNGCLFVNSIGSDRTHRQRPTIVASTGLGTGSFATLVHPAAAISSGAELGSGVSVGPCVCVGRNVSIGDHVWLGAGCIVGHDSVIDGYSVVAPGAIISGSVHIGAATYIGAGAVIRPGANVGSGALVGMGAVVTKDIAADAVVVGNPAHLHQRSGRT